MSCQKCGSQTPRSRLCKACSLDERYSSGPVGGTGSDGEEWDVEQTGLGERDPEGQATLDGGIAREADDE